MLKQRRVGLKHLKNQIFAATSLLLLGAGTALAGTYDALCGDMECQISVSGKGVSSPAGFTPKDLISQWNVGKASDYDAGKGVASGLGGATAGAVGGAILLGPIGLLGGLIGGAIAGSDAGKEFEGYFTIVGYNKKKGEGGELPITSFSLIASPSKDYSPSCHLLLGLPWEKSGILLT